MAKLSASQRRKIQGIGLVGFRKDHQRFIGVRFGDVRSGRRLLAYLAPRVASAYEVAAFNASFSEMRKRNPDAEGILEATWTGVLVSAAGYRNLGVPLDDLPDTDGAAAFTAGMAARSAEIGDTRETDAPAGWLRPFRPGEGVDALIVLASDDSHDLSAAAKKLIARIKSSGCSKVFDQRGQTLPGKLRGHEHFGFKDGVSQPSIVDWSDNPPAPNEPSAVALGEFVLGYPDEAGLKASVGSLWRDGSFVVYRRVVPRSPVSR